MRKALSLHTSWAKMGYLLFLPLLESLDQEPSYPHDASPVSQLEVYCAGGIPHGAVVVVAAAATMQSTELEPPHKIRRLHTGTAQILPHLPSDWPAHTLAQWALSRTLKQQRGSGSRTAAGAPEVPRRRPMPRLLATHAAAAGPGPPRVMCAGLPQRGDDGPRGSQPPADPCHPHRKQQLWAPQRRSPTLHGAAGPHTGRGAHEGAQHRGMPQPSGRGSTPPFGSLGRILLAFGSSM
mmetsp:Transcript_32304/g.66005  ORF Transcript_32304/g.66005 Transcript_32304/m.66005 type:complete len:237 (+) Transcript_32304:354-1064(+)